MLDAEHGVDDQRTGEDSMHVLAIRMSTDHK